MGESFISIEITTIFCSIVYIQCCMPSPILFTMYCIQHLKENRIRVMLQVWALLGSNYMLLHSIHSIQVYMY